MDNSRPEKKSSFQFHYQFIFLNCHGAACIFIISGAVVPMYSKAPMSLKVVRLLIQ